MSRTDAPPQIKQNFRSDAHFRAVVKDIHDGNCVLFVGAGVSAPHFPSWKELETKMKRAAQLEKEYGPLRTADCCLEQLGSGPFHDLLKEVFDITVGPTPLHHALARLPVKVFVTTNYDNLLENALRAVREHVRVVPNTNKYPWPHVAVGTPTTWVLKIHGSAETFPDGIVIGERDYLKYSDDYPHVTQCLSNLFARHSVVFMGYSLSDPNVGQILFDVQRITAGSSTNRYFVALDAETAMVRFFENRDTYHLRVINVRGGDGKTELLDLVEQIAAEFTVPEWFIAHLRALNCFVEASTLQLQTPLARIYTGVDSTMVIRLALRIEAERRIKLPLERIVDPDIDIRGFLRIVEDAATAV